MHLFENSDYYGKHMIYFSAAFALQEITMQSFITLALDHLWCNTEQKVRRGLGPRTRSKVNKYMCSTFVLNRAISEFSVARL